MAHEQKQCSPKQRPRFFLTDEGNVDDDCNGERMYMKEADGKELNEPIELPKRKNKAKKLGSTTVVTNEEGVTVNQIYNSNSIGSTMKDDVVDLEEILAFPNDSPHAYSYAHLSPNSLALRLSVLKRSLQILQQRPKLFKPVNTDEAFSHERSYEKIKDGSMPFSPYLNPSRNNSTDIFMGDYKFESNASTAALSALFKPQMRRADSFPAERLSSAGSLKVTPAKPGQSNNAQFNPMFNDDLKDIVDLLENDANAILANSDVASSLHDISLSKINQDHKLKHDFLRNKLLYALATPFVEKHFVMNNQIENNNDIPGTPNIEVTSFMSSQNNNGRLFPTLSSGKHMLHRSIFTIDAENPWRIKAANDLACLMFGVSKQTIKALTLLDLVAPQFRVFVTSRLTGNITSSPSNYKEQNDKKDEIFFAGEIVAIARTGKKEYAWTSIWAKRKNNLIICMFDQIHSDAFDIVISSGKDEKDAHNYQIDSINEVSGSLLDQYDLSRFENLYNVTESLDHDLKTHHLDGRNGRTQDSLDADSSRINNIRYYTAHFNDSENIPCAISSEPNDYNNERREIRLKIHSLPYIAGIFLISAKNFEILSCNNAITNNLFGRSSNNVKGSSISIIIPKFVEILRAGSESLNLNLSPGLVLPEHFFRRFDAVLKSKSDPLSDEEEIFFNSSGIEGIHRDGTSIYIDLQLRVSPHDMLILWVTYSRREGSPSISKEFNRLSSSTSSMSLNSNSDSDLTEKKRPQSTNQKARLDVNLPSQLKLLPDNSSDLFDFIPNTPEMSRSTSTKKPKTNQFVLPLRNLSHSASRVSLSRRDSSSSSDHDMSDSAPKSDSSKETSALSEQEKLPHYEISGPLDEHERFSELQLLKIENKLLDERRSKSKLWPTVVGAKRRTKKFSEFNVIKQIGEGAYGKVIQAQHKEDPDYEIIVKCIDKERILVDTWVRDRNLGTVPSEIQIMAFLNTIPHPNIMRIVDFFEDKQYYYLETPLFGDPLAIDLFDFIEVKTDLSEQECQIIFKQIVMAVYHLHKHGIAHRDIKDENIIIDENGIVKLIDFGSSGYTKQGPFDVFVGTMDYASPEVLEGGKYDGKPQDVWALGILLYTLLYKENPFYNVDEIMEGRLKVPYVVSEQSLNLVERILTKDVMKRPTVTDIADDKWLNL